MKCIACHNKGLKVIHVSDNCAGNVQKLLKWKDIVKDKTTKIKILQCGACGLAQLRSRLLPVRDYSGYLMTTSYSDYSKSYQAELARDFVCKFGLEGKYVVEIGCGDGSFLETLKANNVNVLGIEPSKKAAGIADKKGLEILNEYLTRKNSLKNKFDGFVIRQVMEHVSAPRNFLKNLRYLLKDSAVGLIEVPSLHKTKTDKRFFDFFPDHVAYYSNSALSNVLENSGYEVLDIFRTAGEEYLVAYVKLKEKNGLKSIWVDFKAFVSRLRCIVADYKKQNKKIAVWGAGGKGIAVLSLCSLNKDCFEFVVDSDTNKWGYYTPVSHIKIVSPENILKVDCVLITAMMYEKEIVRQIIKMGYKGDIGVISPSPRILTKDEIKKLCRTQKSRLVSSVILSGIRKRY